VITLGFIILCIVWGTTWLAIKFSLEGLPPFLGAGIRFTSAWFILLLYIIWKKIRIRVNGKEFGILVISAFLVYPVDYGLLYWAEQHINAGVAAVFFATFPFFTSIWSNFLFRHEKFHWYTFSGLFIGFAGIVIVFFDQLAITQFNRLVLMSSFAVITGAASAAMSLVIIKKHLPKINPFTLTFHQLYIGVFFLFLIGLPLEDINAIRFNTRIVLSVAYLGIVGSAFAFVLYYRLLQNMSAITLSLIIYITPVVALITDYIVFREFIPIRSIIGVTIVFLGISITQGGIKKLMLAINRFLK
jgi:drug/metabolite transporter (DMT)-like permease